MESQYQSGSSTKYICTYIVRRELSYAYGYWPLYLYDTINNIYEPKGLDFSVQNKHQNLTQANITVQKVTLQYLSDAVTNFGVKQFNESIDLNINSNLKKVKLSFMAVDNSYDVFGTSYLGHGRLGLTSVD